MMRSLSLLPLLLTIGLGGCISQVSQQIQEINKEPAMSPVGAGQKMQTVAMVTAPAQRPVYARGNSLWQDNAADMFKDARAVRVGDVVTVKISIKDQASLDNTSNRTRQSSRDSSQDYGYSLDSSALGGTHLKSAGDGSFKASGSGNTQSKGEGAITRSESINLLVAAVVTDILPNGNLVISGKQEVRVNYEVRDLTVAGVVRPRDIATDNTISYEKVAEARISYGGRGRMSEVQQPGWGQQLMDIVSPF